MVNKEIKRGDAVIWRASDWWHAGYVERIGQGGNYAVRTTKGNVEQIPPNSLCRPNQRQIELFFPEEKPHRARR